MKAYKLNFLVNEHIYESKIDTFDRKSHRADLCCTFMLAASCQQACLQDTKKQIENSRPRQK